MPDHIAKLDPCCSAPAEEVGYGDHAMLAVLLVVKAGLAAVADPGVRPLLRRALAALPVGPAPAECRGREGRAMLRTALLEASE